MRIAPRLVVGAALTVQFAPALADVYECVSSVGVRYTDAKDPGCTLFVDDKTEKKAEQRKGTATPVSDQARRRALLPTIQSAARRHGVLPSLLEALIQVESNFRFDAVSVKGALGLTQLMPATASSLGVRDVFDATANIDGGARHLRSLLDRYRGNQNLALAAYNAGAGAVERYQAIPPYAETQAYVSRVTRLERLISSSPSLR